MFTQEEINTCLSGGMVEIAQGIKQADHVVLKFWNYGIVYTTVYLN